MKRYIYGAVVSLFFVGCVHEHQINIGDISIEESTHNSLRAKEYYISFTQTYYDNKLYPINQYCDDQRSYLSNDRFSTETYLKVTNVRTKQNRVGKYPIWFLLNDDASNISCMKKSANFINKEPLVVSSSDKLSVKLLQKNEAASSVPVQELGILMDMVSLFVPSTANFLMRTENVIKDPIVQNYLNVMDDAFKHGDLDGTKSKYFNTKTKNIQVKLYVPKDKNSIELGYILLRPEYRTTLTTVDAPNGVPNFRSIYTTSDPRIKDLMSYILPDKKIGVGVVVDNFRQVADEHLIESLASLNTNLMNRFTRYDRALILSLAVRQSDLYRRLVSAVHSKNIKELNHYLMLLNSKKNPLNSLEDELKETGCDYFSVIYQAKEILKQIKESQEEQRLEAERQQQIEMQQQMALQSIENFLTPVATWNYLPQMFLSNVQIRKTTGETLSISDLQQRYNRREKVADYGCYVALQREIPIQTKTGSLKRMTLQDYLIHPNYSYGNRYDYMAISIDKSNLVDILFYKFQKEGDSLKISQILIDSSNLFISRHRVKEILKNSRVQSCSNTIRRFF